MSKSKTLRRKGTFVERQPDEEVLRTIERIKKEARTGAKPEYGDYRKIMAQTVETVFDEIPAPDRSDLAAKVLEYVITRSGTPEKVVDMLTDPPTDYEIEDLSGRLRFGLKWIRFEIRTGAGHDRLVPAQHFLPYLDSPEEFAKDFLRIFEGGEKLLQKALDNLEIARTEAEARQAKIAKTAAANIARVRKLLAAMDLATIDDFQFLINTTRPRASTPEKVEKYLDDHNITVRDFQHISFLIARPRRLGDLLRRHPEEYDEFETQVSNFGLSVADFSDLFQISRSLQQPPWKFGRSFSEALDAIESAGGLDAILGDIDPELVDPSPVLSAPDDDGEEGATDDDGEENDAPQDERPALP